MGAAGVCRLGVDARFQHVHAHMMVRQSVPSPFPTLPGESENPLIMMRDEYGAWRLCITRGKRRNPADLGEAGSCIEARQWKARYGMRSGGGKTRLSA